MNKSPKTFPHQEDKGLKNVQSILCENKIVEISWDLKFEKLSLTSILMHLFLERNRGAQALITTPASVLEIKSK